MLLKRPGFTVLAALTLAVGIGATAAVFSLVEGVLLTPPPYRDPDRLVIVPSVRVDSQQVERIEGMPAVHWMDWQQHATSFESIAAHGWTFNFRIDNAGSESIEGMTVTPEYFRVVGVQPMLGRAFTADDAKPGQPSSVIILGYEYWQRRFNGDPAIVGKTIRMSRRDTPPTIIGVMPPGVRFSAVAGGIAGAELRRRCDGGFPEPRRAKSAASEVLDVGRRWTPEAWRDPGAGADRARPARG